MQNNSWQQQQFTGYNQNRNQQQTANIYGNQQQFYQSSNYQLNQGQPTTSYNPPQVYNQNTANWIISPQEKLRYDQLFREQDQENNGFLSGKVPLN
jgi:hypothetical protein